MAWQNSNLHNTQKIHKTGQPNSIVWENQWRQLSVNIDYEL